MGKTICKDTRKRLMLGYAVIFVLLFLLASLFPYSGDDWAWGSQIGLDRLSNWFDDYSGRYFGNLIVLALTRSNLLKAFTMSFCLTGILVLVNRLTGEQKNGVFMISTLLLFMPVTLLRQAVVWTSGFANYTTSIFLTLIYIYYVNNIYGENKLRHSLFAAVPLLALGAANTLIVEHLTLYNIVLAVYVLLYTAVKFRKVYVQHIAYFAGTIAGTVLMFSNSVYRSVASGTDGYRTISSDEGIIVRALKAYFGNIIYDGFIYNLVLNIFLAVMCLAVWFTVKNRLTGIRRVLGTVSVTVITAFSAASLMFEIGSVNELFLLKILQGIAVAFYILAFIVFLFILPFDLERKVKLLFLLGSIGCMIAPLTVVTPIGSRCFFAPYVMMIYLGMELYTLLDQDIKEKCDAVSKTAIVTAIVGIIYLFYIYGTIAVSNQERVEKAITDSQEGAGTIQVEELPYKEYVWCCDLDDEWWESRFKLFYNIDSAVSIEQISSVH